VGAVDVLSFASIWVSVAVALVLLLKAQAKHLAEMRSELEASRHALSSSGSQVLALAARLDDIEGLKVGVVSQLSHELRTPIAAIRQAAAVITRYGDTKPDTSRSFAEKISREADRLTGMVENLFAVLNTTGSKDADIGVCEADPGTRQRCKSKRAATAGAACCD
jgi:signal transduction histidine kinase